MAGSIALIVFEDISMIKSVRFGVLALSLGWGVSVFGDADISVQPSGTTTSAQANVDLCVVVPEILIFGVGAVGDPIAKIIWTFSAAGYGAGNNSYTGGTPAFTLPAPFDGDAIASFGLGGGQGTGTLDPAEPKTAKLPVYLFSNNGGDVNISTTQVGGTLNDGAGNTISLNEFDVLDGGSINHPGLFNTNSMSTSPIGGIVNVADVWEYTYITSTIPVAGTYETRITYTASHP